jgi:hypothetical protein
VFVQSGKPAKREYFNFVLTLLCVAAKQKGLSLAHWIMGDGSKQNEGLHLSVYAFSQSNVEILTDALKNRYGLHCTIHATESGPRIYINKNSVNILRPSYWHISFLQCNIN